LRGIVEDAIAAVRRDLCDVRIEINVHGNEVRVAADADLVRATIVNLLRNGIHAIPGGGRIDVTVGLRDEMAFVEVRDTGPGIPPEIRSRVLEPFFTTKVRGGGLGLPIARRTADLHGGSLDLDFPADGGTRVTLRLPVQPFPGSRATSFVIASRVSGERS
jgi:signal transduction histidine kinase